eukprot:07613_2
MRIWLWMWVLHDNWLGLQMVERRTVFGRVVGQQPGRRRELFQGLCDDGRRNRTGAQRCSRRLFGLCVRRFRLHLVVGQWGWERRLLVLCCAGDGLWPCVQF